MRLLLHKRPSEILHLQGSETWLFEVDYQLLMSELELSATSNEETVETKKDKIRTWKKRLV